MMFGTLTFRHVHDAGIPWGQRVIVFREGQFDRDTSIATIATPICHVDGIDYWMSVGGHHLELLRPYDLWAPLPLRSDLHLPPVQAPT